MIPILLIQRQDRKVLAFEPGRTTPTHVFQDSTEAKSFMIALHYQLIDESARHLHQSQGRDPYFLVPVDLVSGIYKHRSLVNTKEKQHETNR